MGNSAKALDRLPMIDAGAVLREIEKAYAGPGLDLAIWILSADAKTLRAGLDGPDPKAVRELLAGQLVIMQIAAERYQSIVSVLSCGAIAIRELIEEVPGGLERLAELEQALAHEVARINRLGNAGAVH